MFTADANYSNFVPFSTHVDAHVVKTREGDYLITWLLSGFPFVGREDWELEHRHRTFNSLLQSLRAPDFENLAFWAHDIRRRRKINANAKFPCYFSQSLHDKYMERLSTKRLMQNELYLTMIYRPVVSGKRFAAMARDINVLRQEEKACLEKIYELVGNVEVLLTDYAPYRLGLYESIHKQVFSENLEFYGYLLNRVDEPVPVVSAPIYSYLPSSRHMFNPGSGDFAIRTSDGNNYYGAILNIKEYAESSWPGILNGLKYLECEYVVTHSFTPMSRYDSMKALQRTKGAMLSSEDKAVSQIVELDFAMDQLASGNFVLGQYHFNMAIYAANQEDLYLNVAQARAQLSGASFVTVKEDVAVAAAFYAQLPCNWRFRPRIANLSSLNFLGLSPLHNFATGKPGSNPWGPSVSVLQTLNNQAYHFNFHATKPNEHSFGEKAVANTMVIGKSGTGKTALINFLLAQVQKLQPEPTVFFFDKDKGAQIFIQACGGRYFSLEKGKPTGFNPLQCDNTAENEQFLVELMQTLCGKGKYSATEQEDLIRAVRAILDTPLHLRTMTNLRKSLPNMGENSLYEALSIWCQDGPSAWVFDNPSDSIEFGNANIIGFDYTEVIEDSKTREPIIQYLLHRMEGLIDGRPFIYVMDEFWKVLEGKGELKDFAKNKQKTIRKQNGFGIFATQSPQDAINSDISAALIEQTATMILLPNPNADPQDYIEGLKLTRAEFDLVVGLDERSRCFLVKQGHSAVLCQLNLNGMDDELAVLSGSSDNVEILNGLLDSHPTPEVPDTWLPEFHARRKGLRQQRDTQMTGHREFLRHAETSEV
ncbi:VirB4 family type IV secretion/conjugal transfer ATPase [Ottowia sp.]|uniref:VirB4 family type IV secretion/conjugal transfer ATPase n=1 Tax=Ottowia sp. TaxID=1898956 RepID=UPI003A864590